MTYIPPGITYPEIQKIADERDQARARFVPRFVPASREHLIRRYVEGTLAHFRGDH